MPCSKLKSVNYREMTVTVLTDTITLHMCLTKTINIEVHFFITDLLEQGKS